MNCDGITIINIGDLMLEKKDDKSIDYVSKIINKFKMQNIDVTSRKIDSFLILQIL